MQKKRWLFIAGLLFLMITAIMVCNTSFVNLLKYDFIPKNELKIKLTLINPLIKSICADPSNHLVMQAEVKDQSGRPVPMAQVKVYVENNIGTVSSVNLRTDEHGSCLITYIPPDYSGEQLAKGNQPISVTAIIQGTSVKSGVNFGLTRVPVIFIHGYQAAANAFDNMREYLSSKDFEGRAFEYKSEEGVIAAAGKLNSFIQQQKLDFLSKGILVNKFDMVCHSLGGLIARYYSCSSDYAVNDDIHKIIFVSTPHKGSHLAALGLSYFNDQGIRDLVPDNELLTEIFPALMNKGLNSRIQVGNILGQFDEVVSPESASLDEWNIRTELFNVGEKSLTMDNLLKGNITDAPNHKTILDNRKVFEKIEIMLNTNLPYPILRR